MLVKMAIYGNMISYDHKLKILLFWAKTFKKRYSEEKQLYHDVVLLRSFVPL